MVQMRIARLLLWFPLVLLMSCTDLTTYSVPIENSSVKVANSYPVYSLPRAYIFLNATYDGTSKLELKWEDVILPDYDARFAIFFSESEVSDDHFTVGINSKGLLTSSVSTNTDETPQIVTKIIQLAELGVGILPAKAPGAPPSTASFNIKVAIDPFDKQSVNMANDIFGKLPLKLKISVIRPGQTPEPRAIADGQEKELKNETGNCPGSLCFRLLVPVIVSISNTSSTASVPPATLVDKHWAVIPDPNTIGWFNIRRGPCIKRDTKISFVDGSVTQFDLDKPSEVLNCIQIPLTIGKAILSVPAALLNVKVTQTKNETDYLAAQTNLLTAQSNLLAAQAKAAGATTK